jgi:hypothetical protein
MFKISFFKFVFAILLVSHSVFKADAQQVTYVALQNQALNFVPKEFYIAGINDARSNPGKIGSLQPFAAVNSPAQIYNIDLKGGIAAVKNFMSYALPVNKLLNPVVLKLKTLNVTEEPVINGTVKGSIKLILSFYLQRGDDLVFLVDYNTTTDYQRRPGPAQQIEPLLRSALGNSLTYLNTWMNQQAGSNIKLAKAVKLYFTDYREPTEGDTIYYNVTRPLQWADFIGEPPRTSKHAAEVFPGIGFDESVKIEKGIVKLTLAIKVYVPKSACWALPSAMGTESLDHEQRHFDIAKLVGEHFKQNLLAEPLPANNYDGNINVLYFDALRELDKMQKQYDGETAHSNNKYQQQLWDTKIDSELLKLGIKKQAP